MSRSSLTQKSEEDKRSRLDIELDILRVAIDNARITRIIYQANLNFDIGPEYVDALVAGGFLEAKELIRGNSKMIFTTTKKGLNVLKYFGLLNEVIDGKLIAQECPPECPMGRKVIAFLPSFFYLTKNWPCASFVV